MYRNRRLYLVPIAAAIVLGGCSPEDGADVVGDSPDNTAPIISGSPITTAIAGIFWQFRPDAFDPDDDPLTFSVTGLPGWATLNSQTGVMSGTPPPGDIGTSSRVVITVSDRARASASLPAFLLNVAPQLENAGEAALSWERPTLYTDGTPLPVEALAFYRVYSGNSASALDTHFNVPGDTTSAIVANLATGAHCFAVSAITTANVESGLSNYGCKIVQ